MKLLRIGATGELVETWQNFLVGKGHNLGEVDGKFGPLTEKATKNFQARNRLVPDGIVGNLTYAKAMQQGFGAVEDDKADENGYDWPPRPAGVNPLTSKERRKLFGKFDYKHTPTERNPEKITADPDWYRENIVKVEIPQLKKLGFVRSGTARFHKLAEDQFKKMWADWDKAGLLDKILSYGGTYNARFIRGSRKTLSNHSYGTAMDINMKWNGLGRVPALKGKEGSVRELVDIAYKNGFFWGGWYRNRKDGMHFEIFKL